MFTSRNRECSEVIVLCTVSECGERLFVVDVSRTDSSDLKHTTVVVVDVTVVVVVVARQHPFEVIVYNSII